MSYYRWHFPEGPFIENCYVIDVVTRQPEIKNKGIDGKRMSFVKQRCIICIQKRMSMS
jgi:hypothetical protein